MAPDQSLVQIRVETVLKDQAVEVFEKIGIDIPTAVRMFFKATVREQGLPFRTDVSTPTGKEVDQKEMERFVDYLKNLITESLDNGEIEKAISVFYSTVE